MRSSLICILTASVALGVGPPASAACDPPLSDEARTVRYAVRDGEVHDEKTGLTWQRCSVGQSWKQGSGCIGAIQLMTWDDAPGQAHDGWRVPTKNELASVAMPGCKNPALDDKVFPNMDPGKLYYWTSEGNRDTTAWYVDFYDGIARSFHRSHMHALRLVRGPG